VESRRASQQSAPIVYVVDDDIAIRETLSSLLRSVGLRMIGFGSTAEFLAHQQEDVPSCLVLDVRLPGTGGLEFQRQLNANKLFIPIIFITGHGDIPMTVRAMKAGAIEFLSKPFRDQSLLDALEIALVRDKERREVSTHAAILGVRYESLSGREKQVLSHLLTGQQNKHIGTLIGATESTVKVHRMQIMRKMEAGSLVELVRMADTLGVKPHA